MNIIKITIISFSILILIIASLLIRRYYLNNDVDYQLKMAVYGNTEEKIKSLSFLSEKKILSIIPTLIDNIDNQDRAHWDSDPKGGLISVSCVATIELENLTGNHFGRFCYYDIGKKNDEEAVKQKWRDWYKNEYPKWLEKQK